MCHGRKTLKTSETYYMQTLYTLTIKQRLLRLMDVYCCEKPFDLIGVYKKYGYFIARSLGKVN